MTGKRISEANIEEAIRDIRIALIESDVNVGVIKSFIAKVKEKSLGEKVVKSVNPSQMFVKIVHDELIDFLGSENSEIKLREPTRASNIVLLGLQGSGKTTTAGKLAYLLKRSRQALLVSLDVRRPAANEQLKQSALKAGVAFYDRADEKDLKKIISGAKNFSKKHQYNLIIWDTAGRAHMDVDLMVELKEIFNEIEVDESLLVCDSMLGQRAADIAKGFKEQVRIDGLIFTKFDSETKGGAVLSVKEIVGSPIKYIGTGEKIEDLGNFDAKRIAERMLGMGDIVGLVEKAQSLVNEEEALNLAEKLQKGEFDLQDYYDQMKQAQKMGSLSSILSMIPGLGGKKLDIDEKKFNKTLYIIDSMTKKERRSPFIINGSRKSRIAKGSGNTILEVNQLLKQYEQMRSVMRKMKNPKEMRQMLKKMGAENIDFGSLENEFYDKLDKKRNNGV